MQDITFKGLTSTLKGNIYNNSTIRSLAYSFPKSGGAVGSVPCEWLTNVPIAERAGFIKDLYKMFSQLVAIQRKTVFFANKKCSRIFNEFLFKYGLIGENDSTKFRYVGSGNFADVVSFKIGKKKYALKIFDDSEHTVLINHIDKEFGNCAEQNNALFLNASENSDWTKFYFGNVLDGFMVTRYVSNDDVLPRKKIKLSDKGLEFLDYDYKNIKLNTNLDYGGFRKLKDFPTGNKVAMWIIKKLKNMTPEKRAEEIEKITSNKRVPNYYDRMIGVKYIQTHIIPKEEEINTRKKGFWNSLLNAFWGMYTD